jgi:two-component system phosphate regulon sensor histidine kinase PhoR
MTVFTLVILLTSWMARFYLKSYLTNQAKNQLKESLTLISESITSQRTSPMKWCTSLKLNWTTRYTLIDASGKVLCDNFLSPEHLDNQLSRPEVQQALRYDYGHSIRFNENEKTNMAYAAIAFDAFFNNLKQRFFIRQMVPLKELDRAMRDLDQAILFFLLPLLILTSLVSLWGAMQISLPLRSILKRVESMKRVTKDKDDELEPHFGDKADHSEKDEWSIVEKTLDKAQKGLERYFEDLYNENEKMSTVMESITDSILALGLEENILFANNHFKKNFLPKEIKRKEISKFKIWEVNRNLELQTLYNDSLIQRKTVKRRNMQLPVREGKHNSYFDIKVNPLIDQNGHIFGVVGVFHDVTERRLAEQMREDFVANVSHEVRTPLTAIKGFAQVINSTPDDKFSNVKPFLSKIEENADRLTHLFNDILNLSVIESKQKINKETINPNDFTQRILSNVLYSYKDKNIEVHTDIQIDKVWANGALLEQVLTNLIENAYKYISEPGSIHLSWTSSDQGRWAIFAITDSGPGIPKQHHARLFERFYRVDSGRSRDAGGTGLGLAIVKHIVQQHQGRINVELADNENKGTRFIVKLPSHYDSQLLEPAGDGPSGVTI